MRPLYLCVLLCFLGGCLHVPTAEEQSVELQAQTGFVPDPSADSTEGLWMTKAERGYPVLFRPQLGNIWGLSVDRAGVGAIGEELGRVGQFLTGNYYSGVGSVTGSPLDRALSAAISRPFTFYFVLKHGKPSASRLDIVSSASTVKPSDPLPSVAQAGVNAGSIYSEDKRFAGRITADKPLMEKISTLQSQYIRVDENAVTFIYGGSEADWSAETAERGGNAALMNDIVEILADLSDKI